MKRFLLRLVDVDNNNCDKKRKKKDIINVKDNESFES